ncbi:MAG: hypothetical protein JWM37_579 [Candidatus Saccharibacteria bacterium]|nr:hypothetical protein [Candidatus Saccharibacteria bacterium]
MSKRPTAEDIQAAAAVLNKLEPGYLPPEIFFAVARLCVLTTVEMVPLRMRNGRVEVLLTRRPADDPNWPDMLHVPGTILRPSDEENNYHSAFDRIFQDELPGITVISRPQFLETRFHQVQRGRESALIHYVEVAGTTPEAEYYPVALLPPEIIDHQVSFIKSAADRFGQSQPR